MSFVLSNWKHKYKHYQWHFKVMTQPWPWPDDMFLGIGVSGLMADGYNCHTANQGYAIVSVGQSTRRTSRRHLHCKCERFEKTRCNETTFKSSIYCNNRSMSYHCQCQKIFPLLKFHFPSFSQNCVEYLQVLTRRHVSTLRSSGQWNWDKVVLDHKSKSHFFPKKGKQTLWVVGLEKKKEDQAVNIQSSVHIVTKKTIFYVYQKQTYCQIS